MTTKKRKAKKPMAWTCLSCDSDYPRDVKFCPSCHIVSPYESGAFPSVKGQSELARLRAIEKAAKEWCGMQGDVTGAFEAILNGLGPNEDK